MTEEEIQFHWEDYLVFAVSLAIGLLVGIVFLLKGRGQKTTDDYLLGGRDMGPVTVGASMLASTLNAVFLLGGVAEVYYRWVQVYYIDDCRCSTGECRRTILVSAEVLQVSADVLRVSACVLKVSAGVQSSAGVVHNLVFRYKTKQNNEQIYQQIK